MYAVLAINIEAALEGAFHYDVPRDLASQLKIGHLVEVEFGRRLAQGIVVGFDETAPVAETKPIIAILDESPVVQPWQIELARWLSQEYLTPLNACLRLMLPPGLTRQADIVVDINPRWGGDGRLTDLQAQLIQLLREKGTMRGRDIRKALPKTEWKTAVTQLANRGILRKATVLDPPRARPKEVRTADLIASPERAAAVLRQLGRPNKQADILFHLIDLDDPLPEITAVLQATNASQSHLDKLTQAELLTIDDLGLTIEESPENQSSIVNRQSSISLAVPRRDALRHALRLRGAENYLNIVNLLARAAEPVALSELYAATGTQLAHLKKLAKLDLIRFGSEEVWRDPLADRDFTPAETPQLTLDQTRVWGRVKVAMIEAGENGRGGEREKNLPVSPSPPLPVPPSPPLPVPPSSSTG